MVLGKSLFLHLIISGSLQLCIHFIACYETLIIAGYKYISNSSFDQNCVLRRHYLLTFLVGKQILVNDLSQEW